MYIIHLYNIFERSQQSKLRSNAYQMFCYLLIGVYVGMEYWTTKSADGLKLLYSMDTPLSHILLYNINGKLCAQKINKR